MWLSRFLVVLIVFALCFPAEAQQPNKIPRIGVLLGRDVPRLKSFRQGMRDLGYIEDKNILIEYRFAKGNLDRISALAADLIDKKVKLILTAGTAWGRTIRSRII
jgi:putative tryptophan/tyrosine transport system substrate-binding protein